MASLFEKYRTPLYVPIPDSTWDDARQAIRDNRKDIDKELMSFALSAMASNPALAVLVPALSKELGISPSADLESTVGLFNSVIGKT